MLIVASSLFFSFSYASNICGYLFSTTVKSPSGMSSKELNVIFLELHNLRLEMLSQDSTATVVARNLFEIKFGELSKYLSSEEIFNGIYSIEGAGKKTARVKRKPVNINSHSNNIIVFSELLTFLNENGFKNIHDTNSSGDHPVHVAARLNDVRLLKMLVDNGAKLDAVNEVEGRQTALMTAAIADSAQAFKLLLEMGLDKESQDKNGKTALMFISENDSISVLKELLEANPALDTGDADGKTALMYALEADSAIVTTVLLNKGAAINLKDRDGKTALMYGAENNSVMSIEHLLNAGAEKEIKDRDGRTALMWAIESGSESVLKKLIEAGADVNAKNRFGESPTAVAREYGHLDFVKLLRKAGAKK
jgi:ankyrin repeat protein